MEIKRKNMGFRVSDAVLQDFRVACAYLKVNQATTIENAMRAFAEETKNKYYPGMVTAIEREEEMLASEEKGASNE